MIDQGVGKKILLSRSGNNEDFPIPSTVSPSNPVLAATSRKMPCAECWVHVTLKNNT